MQKLGGLLLILSGLSLGTYTFLPPPFDGEQAMREITRISAAPDRVQVHTQGRQAWVEPVAAQPAVKSTPADARAADRVSRTSVETAALETPARPPGTWTAVVTASAGQGRMTSPKASDGTTRAHLTRDLQQELQRVGCYAGEVNGMWTPSTRRAMGSFMDRVNATLPLDEPDYILLTLVQGHRGSVCGARCPSGQSVGTDGRCLPDSVAAARATKSSKRLAVAAAQAETKRSAESTQAAAEQQRSAPITTAALGQSNRRDAAGARHDGDLIAQPDSNERLPWLANKDDLSVPVPEPRRARRPDGMMAVGASQLAKADFEEPAPMTGERPRSISRQKTPAMALDEDYEDLPEAGLPAPRPKAAQGSGKRKATAARKATPASAKPNKQKYIYFAGGRRGAPRPGSPAFNMLQAMGGIY
jgi:hypothetical protein